MTELTVKMRRLTSKTTLREPNFWVLTCTNCLNCSQLFGDQIFYLFNFCTIFVEIGIKKIYWWTLKKVINREMTWLLLVNRKKVVNLSQKFKFWWLDLIFNPMIFWQKAEKILHFYLKSYSEEKFWATFLSCRKNHNKSEQIGNWNKEFLLMLMNFSIYMFDWT